MLNSDITRRTGMHTQASEAPVAREISHPRFAAYYQWMTSKPEKRREFDPLRREIIKQAYVVVLEVGAGGGQNFPFYDPARVLRVEAVEPDAAMLTYSAGRLSEAPVSIRLSRAAVESLPFPDASFDSVVATLVFCSVADPARGLSEIWRTLKPGGALLLLEHVRAHDARIAWIQGALAPLTTRLAGNCHWNRDTQRTVLRAGFQITQVQQVRGGLEPVVLMQAKRPEHATSINAQPSREAAR
jgi:ubiquinone/menaquinone biosynthesis C-methylase UbiE